MMFHQNNLFVSNTFIIFERKMKNGIPILRNILAIIAGVLIGGQLNMYLIKLSPSIIAPPPGADVLTMEGLKNCIHLFEPKHFIMPFLAHALGALVAATIASALAATRKMRLSIIIGVVFLAGGIGAVYMLPAPMWFNVLDLTMAYLPMGYLGGKLGILINKEK